jgi:hypothetical protein
MKLRSLCALQLGQCKSVQRVLNPHQPHYSKRNCTCLELGIQSCSTLYINTSNFETRQSREAFSRCASNQKRRWDVPSTFTNKSRKKRGLPSVSQSVGANRRNKECTPKHLTVPKIDTIHRMSKLQLLQSRQFRNKVGFGCSDGFRYASLRACRPARHYLPTKSLTMPNLKPRFNQQICKLQHPFGNALRS